MLDSKTFQGIDHKIQRLYIHWDITTKCNYNCNYCYAKLDYSKENNWQNESKIKDINNIITSLRFSTLPVFLGLLGGEPTESKNYFYILEEIQNKILPRHKDNRLYITTNLNQDITYWEKHPKIKNTFILCSFHPEYFKNLTEERIKLFIEKLEYLNKYFKVKVNIMLDPKYDNITNEWLKYLPNISKEIIIHPHIIYPDGNPHNDLQKLYKTSLNKYQEIYKYMDKEYEYIINDKKEYLNDIEVFSKNLTFKNWSCYQNNYEISFNGFVSSTCFPGTFSLETNLMYFKKIKKILPKKCPHDFCNCDGLLKCQKILN